MRPYRSQSRPWQMGSSRPTMALSFSPAILNWAAARVACCLEGSRRGSCESQRCQKVVPGGEDQEGGDGSQVFEEPAPIFFIALRQRSSARSQTVWKAKASRFRDTAERLARS